MPQTFRVEGIGTLEFPDDATQGEIQQFLDENYNRVRPSAVESFARQAALGVLPSVSAGYGARLGSALGITSGPGLFATGAVGALGAGIGTAELQQAVLPKIFPRFQEYIQADIEQHPIASKAGQWVSGLAGFRFQPLKGVASLPAFLRGKATPEQARTALGVAGSVGLGAGIGVVDPLIRGQTPTVGGVAEAAAFPLVFGSPRGPFPVKVPGRMQWKLQTPREAPGMAPRQPPAQPEVRQAREAFTAREATATGRRWAWVEGEIENYPNDIARTNEDGTIVISRKNLHESLEQYFDPGTVPEDAIRRIIDEEGIHGAAYTLPKGKEKVTEFWDNFTGLEKKALGRIILGPRAGTPKDIADWDSDYSNSLYMGMESSRYLMQRAAGNPTEFISLAQRGGITTRMLDQLLGFMRWIRETMGTKASESQLDYLKTVENTVIAAKKGAEYASRQQETAALHGDVRAQPFQSVREVPVQEGGARVQPQAPARVVQVPTEEVLLKLVTAQHKVIDGLQPGEAILESAVLQGGGGAFGRGTPVYGSNHPDILDKIDPSGALKTQYETRESRNTDAFGYRTNQRPFVSRMSLKVRATGKPPHSDDIPSLTEPGEKVGDQKDLETPPVAPEKAPPAALTTEGPPPAPGAVAAGAPGVTAPGAEPAISQPTPTGEPVKKGPAELAWEQYGDLMIAKMRAGERMAPLERLEWDKLYRAAVKERPGLTTEGAGVTMRGRAVAPYSKKEAVRIISQHIPQELPLDQQAIREMADIVTATPMPHQDAVLNKVLQVVEEQKQEWIQSKIAAGMMERPLLPPEVESKVVLSLYAYWGEPTRPVQVTTPLRVEEAKTKGGKEYLKLPTVEKMGHEKRMRYVTHDPRLWINEIVRRATLKRPVDPVINAISDRQLMAIYDRHLQTFLHNAPAAVMENLRQGHKLNRGDLRGYIPEPETDPTLRMYWDVKSGQFGKDEWGRAAPEKLKLLAQQNGIDPAQEGWKEKLLTLLWDKARAKFPEMGLAMGLDITDPKFEQKVSKIFYGRELRRVKDQIEPLMAEHPTPEGKKEALDEFYRSEQVHQRRRARLERLLEERMKTANFVPRRSALRNKIDLNDIDWETSNYVGSYAQFMSMAGEKAIEPAPLTLAPSPATAAAAERTKLWQSASTDLKFLDAALVDGAGGRGGDTKRVTFLFNTENQDVEAVSTYRHDGTKEVMLYDPNKPPGRHDYDYVRLNSIFPKYRVLGTTLLSDPVGYFHQKWASDPSATGLQKWWKEFGETANAAAEGEEAVNRLYKRRQEQRQKERRTELESRFALSSEEKAAKERLDKIEAGEQPAETVPMSAEGPSTAQLMDFRRRFELLETLGEPETSEELGPKVTTRKPLQLQIWEQRETRRGAMQLAQHHLVRPEVTMLEGRNLAKWFYRFKIEDWLDLSKALERIQQLWREGKGLSLDDLTAMSALRKMAEQHFKFLTPHTGIKDVIRSWAISARLNPKDPNTWNAYFKEKAQQARIMALKDAVSFYEQTRAEGQQELAELSRRSAERARLEKAKPEPGAPPIADAILPFFRDRYAQRVTDAYGDHAWSDIRGAVSRDAVARAWREALQTRKPGETAEQTIQRLRLLKNLPPPSAEAPPSEFARELTVPEGVPPPLPAEMISPTLFGAVPSYRYPVREVGGTRGLLTPAESAYVREQAARKGIPLFPGSIKEQLAAATDLREVAVQLGSEQPMVPLRPGERVLGQEKITGRDWLKTKEGKEYMAERWGIKRGTDDQRFERLMDKLTRAVDRQERMREMEGMWQQVSPATTGEVGPRVPVKSSPMGAGATMRGLGVARKNLEALAKERGWGDFPPSIPYRPTSEMMQEGEKLVMGGKVYPPQVMDRAEATGKFNTAEAAALRWWGEELMRDADQIGKDTGRNSTPTKLAEEQLERWLVRYNRVISHGAHEHMMVLHGIRDVDTGNFVAVKRKLKEITEKQRRSITSDELSEIEAGVGDVEAAEKDQADHTRRTVEAGIGSVDEPPLDPELERAVARAKDSLADWIKRGYEKDPRTGAAMSMKRASGAPLSAEERDLLIRIGVDQMIKLSEANRLSEETWRQEMLKVRPWSAQYLGELWGEAQKSRDYWMARSIGVDKRMAPAVNRLTRQRPDVEKSKAILKEAWNNDPDGRYISTDEAKHGWNFFDQKYMGKIMTAEGTPNFDAVLAEAAKELGQPPERFYKTLTSKRSVRLMTEELYKKMDKTRRLRAHMTNWLENKEFPWLVRWGRLVPRVMFMDKILGHGFVGLITHASNLFFQPWAWKDYFRAWPMMYRMVSSKDAHRWLIQRLMQDETFEFWKRYGLMVDPFRYTGDYEAGNLYAFMRDKTYGRGFDALKVLRLRLANTWYQSFPLHQQTKELAEMIANDVNHLTGTESRRFREWTNWAFFAPKLVSAQWGVMVRDPLKAANYLLHWNTSTPVQRAWAMSELMHKATMVGVYALMLAVNKGLLEATGSTQKINTDDPRRSDFLAFKIGGFNVGVAGPLIQIVRLFSDLLHIGLGQQSKMERLQTRGERFGGRVWEYARRKFSPFASMGLELYTGQDYMGRPLPWKEDPLSRTQRLRGMREYRWPEWLAQAFSPIPIEEAVRETWAQMGMDRTTASKWWHTLSVAVPMTMTGARVWEDPYAPQAIGAQ